MCRFSHFDGCWGENAQLAWDTINVRSVQGIPTWMLNVMDWDLLESVSGHADGAYQKRPEEVYRDFQLKCGTCAIDQWIPRNPLSMTKAGFEPCTQRLASTGLGEVIIDDVVIHSPEAVAEHLETFIFPRLERQIQDAENDTDLSVEGHIRQEVDVQNYFGMNMLKIPYEGFTNFPTLRYTQYGYENYFMAYALYPELIAKDFKLQADLAVARNSLSARAIIEGDLPAVLRLDHDMADSSGTLVDIKSLDDVWFPEFHRSIQPFLDADIRLLWHCDGNLMHMVPLLIECGVSGFQGFQYEDGMDYKRICKMTDRDGKPLMIWAGVSVTTTLPYGTQDEVRKEMQWLVEHGPKAGLFLAASSSVAPGTNQDNVLTMIEGLTYYRKHGRS